MQSLDGTTCCNCGEKITGDRLEHLFDDGKVKHTFKASQVNGHTFCNRIMCSQAGYAQLGGRRNQSDCKCRINTIGESHGQEV